jgi:hypothetical protein
MDATPKMSRAVTGVLTLLFAAVVSIADLGCQTAPVQTVLHAFTSKNDRTCRTAHMALDHSDQFFVNDYDTPTQSAPTARHVSFPEVRDWNSVCITLSRTVCFTGQSPAYRIEIHGDGTVLYEGKENVVVKGQHRTATTPDKVRQLVNAFREGDYYSLQDYYEGEMFGDAATYQTSIEIDGQVKQVRERVGDWAGMPATVSKLEHSIDTLANAQQWIGNPR